MSLSECQDMYWPSPARVLDTMLCARGGKGIDACTGDSGGPLVIQRGAGKHYIIGITRYLRKGLFLSKDTVRKDMMLKFYQNYILRKV